MKKSVIIAGSVIVVLIIVFVLVFVMQKSKSNGGLFGATQSCQATGCPSNNICYNNNCKPLALCTSQDCSDRYVSFASRYCFDVGTTQMPCKTNSDCPSTDPYCYNNSCQSIQQCTSSNPCRAGPYHQQLCFYNPN